MDLTKKSVSDIEENPYDELKFSEIKVVRNNEYGKGLWIVRGYNKNDNSYSFSMRLKGDDGIPMPYSSNRVAEMTSLLQGKHRVVGINRFGVIPGDKITDFSIDDYFSLSYFLKRNNFRINLKKKVCTYG